MEKRLYRNEHDKWIAGVSSGLADYLGIDVKIVRLLFCLSIPFLAGTGLLVYIVMWIVVPANNDPSVRFKKFTQYYQNDPMFNSPNAFSNPSNSEGQTKWNTENVGADFRMPNDPNQFDPLKKSNDTSRTIGGLILLVIGLYLLLRITFDVIPPWFSIWKLWKLWPVAIIAIGISLIFRNQRKNEWENFKRNNPAPQQPSAQPDTEDVLIVEDKNNDPASPSA